MMCVGILRQLYVLARCAQPLHVRPTRVNWTIVIRAAVENANGLGRDVVVVEKGRSAVRIERDVGGEGWTGCTVHALKAHHTGVKSGLASSGKPHECDPFGIDACMLREQCESR